MTRVDFYVLGPQARGDRYLLACRLTEKAWQQGHRVYLHTGGEQEARHLERLLWTFRDGSFLPHGLQGEADPATNPILVGHGTEAGDEHDVLINLALEVPPFFSRFERVAEPLDLDPEIRGAGRNRFRFYRDRGYAPNSHDIPR